MRGINNLKQHTQLLINLTDCAAIWYRGILINKLDLNFYVRFSISMNGYFRSSVCNFYQKIA